MKITTVIANNRRKAFEVTTRTGVFRFPFVRANPTPSPDDQVRDVYPDTEIGREGFTYVLASGREGTIHIDAVLEYNKDPKTMADLLLYNLTVEARKRVERSDLSTREIIRRLGTSATQFYRLLDQTNYSKSLNQLVALLSILDCDVELVVKRKRTA